MEKIIYRLTLDTHKNGIQKTLQGFETADKIARRIAINQQSERLIQIRECIHKVRRLLWYKR